MTATLDTFQHEVIDFVNAAQGRAIYADPMGGRKTGTTASWLRQSAARRTLVVAPKSVHVTHWYNELQRWWPEARLQLGRGDKKKRVDQIHALGLDSPTGQVAYVCTYDAMKADEAELLSMKIDTVVFDEGHKLKGRTTQVAKSANRFAKAERCLVVTGTPVMNKAEELWQYLHMLFPKDFRSFHAWVDEHFKITYANFRGKMVKQIGDFLPGHEDIVRAQLSGVIIQRELAELFPGEVWIEEPEHIAIDVELSKAERKIYDSLVEHSWAQTEMRKPIIGSNALSVQTKLRQMSSDWGNIDPDLAIGSKITAAVELIPELAREKPVLVLATYRATCNRLAQALSDKGLRVAVWTGEFTNWQVTGMADFLLDRFDVVVGTIASLAEGVDGLQYRTNQLVMLDHDWTYAVNEQAIGRLKRQGQSLRTVVYHLYAKDTVDRTVLTANLRKLNVTQTLKGRPLHDVLYGVDDIEITLEDE